MPPQTRVRVVSREGMQKPSPPVKTTMPPPTAFKRSHLQRSYPHHCPPGGNNWSPTYRGNSQSQRARSVLDPTPLNVSLPLKVTDHPTFLPVQTYRQSQKCTVWPKRRMRDPRGAWIWQVRDPRGAWIWQVRELSFCPGRFSPFFHWDSLFDCFVCIACFHNRRGGLPLFRFKTIFVLKVFISLLAFTTDLCFHCSYCYHSFFKWLAAIFK